MDWKVERSLLVSVPGWIDEVVAEFAGLLGTDEERMQLALALARRNVECGGGPFGAVVFRGTWLVGAGVNRVLATGFSMAHAEILALMQAERRALSQPGVAGPDETHDPSPGSPYTLVTSTEPCVQCFGAVLWSGVERVVCGATSADAQAIGFDEGPKPQDWAAALRRRDIEVTEGVCSEAAREVLTEYRRRGGTIYGRKRRATPFD